MVDERFERSVMGMKRCPSCDSDDIGYKIIGYPPNNIMVRYICLNCGASTALPHIENLKRRSNTSLNHWKGRVIKKEGTFCRLCGASNDLEVHHLIPVVADSERKYVLNDGNGIVLCKRCHRLIHHIWGIMPLTSTKTFREVQDADG